MSLGQERFNIYFKFLLSLIFIFYFFGGEGRDNGKPLLPEYFSRITPTGCPAKINIRKKKVSPYCPNTFIRYQTGSLKSKTSYCLSAHIGHYILVCLVQIIHPLGKRPGGFITVPIALSTPSKLKQTLFSNGTLITCLYAQTAQDWEV